MAVSISTSLVSTTAIKHRRYLPSPPPSLPPTQTLKPLQSLSHFPKRHRSITGQFHSSITASAVSSSPGAVSSAAEELDEIKVLDLEGNPVSITDLWKDRKAVVAFARHFGCVFCRKRADYLATKKELMDAVGVALVLIGPGSTDQARAFKQQTEFKGEVYADPNQSAYAALKFVSGASTTFTPKESKWAHNLNVQLILENLESGASTTFTTKAGLKIIQLYMEGYRQDWALTFQKETVEKGGWQQGGILVAGPGKSNISYVFKDQEAGDEPAIEDVLKAFDSRE